MRHVAIMVRRDVGELAAGEWRRDGDRIELACVACGHVQQLDARIAPCGTVEGAQPCASISCPLVIWMELAGWAQPPR